MGSSSYFNRKTREIPRSSIAVLSHLVILASKMSHVTVEIGGVLVAFRLYTGDGVKICQLKIARSD
jgi:hypothetical protein